MLFRSRTTNILNILKNLNRTLHANDEAFYKIPDNSDEIAQQMLLYEGARDNESEYWIDYDYRRLRLKVDISTYNSGETEKEIKNVTMLAQKLFPGAKISLFNSYISS